MKISKESNRQPGDRHRDVLENRLGLQIAGRLQHSAEALPHDIVERLRFARERALVHARVQRAHSNRLASSLQSGGIGTAALGGPPSVWLRLASALPLLVLVAGLLLIQQHHEIEQIYVAAEIDAALLADAVPPAAYRDPGFGEFLRDADLP